MKNFYQNRSSRRTITKISGLHKWVSLAAILFLLQLSAIANAQGITLHFKGAPLEKVISSISKQSSYNFFYDADFLKKAAPVTVDVDKAPIEKVLPLVFSNQPFSYQVTDQSILLKEKSKAKALQSPAADEIIHGMITDAEGLPIPGATITIKGTSVTTQSDGTGHFYLRASVKNPVIIVKYMGFLTKEIVPQGDQHLSIVMNPNSVVLDDVVVTGYQTISKDRSAAAATNVSNTKLNAFINTDLAAALEGKVAGLSLYKDRPVLRGVSTLSSSIGTTPLLVIDGLPTELALEDINPYDIESVTVLKDAAAASIYGSRSANGVIVLTTKKGMKGKTQISFNTDFFITEKPDLDKMHYASTSDMIDYEKALYQSELSKYNGSTSNLFAYYGGIGVGGTPKYYSPIYALYRQQADGRLTADQVNNTMDSWRNNDYYSQYVDQVYQNESRQRYNLSLSSASDKSNTYFSFNYDRANQQVRNNNDEKLNMYFKSAYNLSDRFTATFGMNASYSKTIATNGDYSSYTIQPRYASITDINGNRVLTDYVNLGSGASGNLNSSIADVLNANSNFKSTKFNVLDELEKNQTRTNNLRVRAFANLDYKILTGLRYSLQGQYEISKTDRKNLSEADSYVMRYLYNSYTSYDAATAKFVHNIPDGGRLTQFNQESNNYTLRQQLDYSKSFQIGKTRHDFVALAGMELRQSQIPTTNTDIKYGYNDQTLTSQLLDLARLNTTGITSYPFNSNQTLSAPTTLTDTKHRYTSFYGNMSYTLNNLYNVTGSIRLDQADLFGAQIKDQYRPLWSIGAGWNATNEAFLSNISWLNYLKVRATYGINGNVDQTTAVGLTAKLTSDKLYPDLTYLNITEFPNPLLRWEKTATTNLGLDFTLFSNRLRGTVDMYHRYSSDLLVNTTLDPTIGTTEMRINNGSLSNNGIEFSFNSDWFNQGGVTLSSSIVFAYNRNKVEKVARAATTAASYISAPADYFYANTIYNSMYAYKYAGMTNGYPVFYNEKGEPNVVFDANGTPTTISSINSPDALEKVGNLTPSYNGSFQQTVKYKGFELGAMFIFYGGNKLRKDVLDLSGFAQTDEDLVNRWTTANPGSTITRLELDYPNVLKTYAGTLSSLYKYSNTNIADASFVRLRNISLSYGLSPAVLKKLRMQKVRLTAQVNNPFLWAAAGDDIDPETYSLNGGTRGLNTPTSFLMGLSVTF